MRWDIFMSVFILGWIVACVILGASAGIWGTMLCSFAGYSLGFFTTRIMCRTWGTPP